MKTFRIVVGSLAILSLVTLVAAVLLPPFVNDQGALLDLYFPAIVIPLFTLNFWAWTYPELIESCLFGKENFYQK